MQFWGEAFLGGGFVLTERLQIPQQLTYYLPFPLNFLMIPMPPNYEMRTWMGRQLIEQWNIIAYEYFPSM